LGNESLSEADAGQTAVGHQNRLERENIKHGNHSLYRDIICRQQKLRVDDADY
jgi:hypothetical protein